MYGKVIAKMLLRLTRHRVGDGLHYINSNFMVFEGGGFQMGDTSEDSIILNIETILSHYDAQYLFSDLWNLAYPDEPMTDEDLMNTIYAAIDHTEAFDTSNLALVRSAINDLRSMGRPELADLVTDVLQGCGLTLIP